MPCGVFRDILVFQNDYHMHALPGINVPFQGEKKPRETIIWVYVSSFISVGICTWYIFL